MFSSYFLIFLVFVSAIPRVAFPQEQPTNAEPSKPTVDKSDNISINERLFKKLFVEKRKKHLKAVKDIRGMDSYEKQYKMVKILAENALSIVEAGRVVIESEKQPKIGETESLKNVTIRDAVTTVLENSALFGDAVLQLPDITRRIVKNQENWNGTIRWALNFVNETHHLLDEPTITMFHLVRQELRIIARDTNYTNPYWNNKDKAIVKDERKPKKYLKDTKKKKGARLVNVEL